MNNEKERALRGHIRSVIHYKLKNKIKSIIQENKLRNSIRNLILEVAAEDPDTDPHEFTGINVLRELFHNSNTLKTLRQVYQNLTTKPEQRKSFRAHIITWVIGTLKIAESTEKATVSEGMDVDIDLITDEERGMMIDADDGSPDEVNPAVDTEPKKEEEEDDLDVITGEDSTGRNRAKEIYGIIEKNILQYFGVLDDPRDIEIFKKWLVVNLKLYFDKWENEMKTTLTEPSSPEYDQAATSAGIETAANTDVAAVDTTQPGTSDQEFSVAAE